MNFRMKNRFGRRAICEISVQGKIRVVCVAVASSQSAESEARSSARVRGRLEFRIHPTTGSAELPQPRSSVPFRRVAAVVRYVASIEAGGHEGVKSRGKHQICRCFFVHEDQNPIINYYSIIYYDV